MTKKDFMPTENNDRQKASGEEWSIHHGKDKQYPDEAPGIGEVDVKNAHASGDGSFGRNDGSVPDKEEDAPAKEGGAY